MKLLYPLGYKKLTTTEKIRITNNSSTKKKFDFIHDTIYFLNVKEACNIHDYMYLVASPKIEEKEEADRLFLDNLLRIIEENTKWCWLRKLRKLQAKKYYHAVKTFGGPAFWAGKHKRV